MSQPKSQSAVRPDGADAAARRSAAARAPSRTRLWIFRLTALVLAPLVFAVALELVLRAIGYGYDPGFLLARQHQQQPVWVQNNQFGWRFFGRDLARWPAAFAIAQSKPTNTVRLVLFGESAARGEPHPDFGPARMLEALLAQRYPDTHFEVVNTAMTAINSHAILPIARDCAKADADIWVVYMGNNEVVGPFGAGTVFGPQTPPLALIRASLAAKSTRTGQLVDSLLTRPRPARADDSIWGGLAMFLGQQVRAAEPRLQGVYDHFARNLANLLRVASRHQAGVVLSTVAVNVRDCAPFASAHRPGLSAAELARWEQSYQLGTNAQAALQYSTALSHYLTAGAIDDTHAELRFRVAECHQALGRPDEARPHFLAARDLDTLRFRCDSRLNELIRTAATNFAGPRLRLAEAELGFASESRGGVTGAEYFYEHVHLNHSGTYLLARTLAEQVSALLPPAVTASPRAKPTWASPNECVAALGYAAWHDVAPARSILATLDEPPFTGQWQQAQRRQKLEQSFAVLLQDVQASGLSDALIACEQALTNRPTDAILWRHLATLRQAAGDAAGAATAATRAIELLPNDPESWSVLGAARARQNQLTAAAEAFQQAFQYGPQGIKSRLELAAALATLGRTNDALREYREILDRKPRSVPAQLQLGRLHDLMGQPAEADLWFRRAYTNRNPRLPELTELAYFLQQNGRAELAAATYREAAALSPNPSPLWFQAGRLYATQGQYPAALACTTEAVRRATDSYDARLLHGIVLHKQGQTAPALEEFQAALRLNPASVDARLNLGLALAQTGRNPEALRWFNEVLQLSPTNQLALKYAQSLRQTNSPP
jgi:tetratricopeptide (TPR) repeat protein